MRVHRFYIVALVAVMFGARAFSQVSPQAPETKKPPTKKIEGKITKLEFTSSHMFIFISVTDSDKDKPATWTIQTGSNSELTAKGITRSDLRVGRIVRAEGTPLPGENRLEVPVSGLSFPQ